MECGYFAFVEFWPSCERGEFVNLNNDGTVAM